ncbi:MAG: molybdopterin converting factor small subunit [Symbiobacteriaceae bacterium]|jgi:molybdopterin synthase sulfur carrier subunit|nr:molybdopterin converting factor small subunit [Symbiobacteriaceae bacterium]
MMVKLFANLRAFAKDGRVEVALPPGATVRDALVHLFARVPALQEHVLDPATGELLPYVQVMLKGRLVRDLQGLDTPVGANVEMAIFPPVAGG